MQKVPTTEVVAKDTERWKMKSKCQCGHEQEEHGMSEVCLHTVKGNFDCDCEKFQPCVEPEPIPLHICSLEQVFTGGCLPSCPTCHPKQPEPPEPQGIVLAELTLAMQQTGAKTQTHRNIQAGFNEGLKHQLIHNSIELIVREASANTQLQSLLAQQAREILKELLGKESRLFGAVLWADIKQVLAKYIPEEK
jgi:hypothetical protein